MCPPLQATLDSPAAPSLLDLPRQIDFSTITSLAARMLHVPVCLVSLVDDKRQVFIGASGLPPSGDPVIGRTPLSHFFGRHAAALRRPLVIRDAREEPLLAEDGTVIDPGVAAYLGFPLIDAGHHFHGAFCAIDTVPRDWTVEELEMMRDFAALAAEQIELNAGRQEQRNSTEVLIHDLKSPLAGIRLLAGAFADHAAELPPVLQPMTGALIESSAKALDLVESLVLRDREMVRSCTDLRSALRTLVQRHAPAAAGKGIEIALEGPDECVPLEAAEWVVEQVAENLLTNALKFTPAGGCVRISIRREAGFGILEVADGGPGFQADDYPRLFQRYGQLSARPTAHEPSTGLGLSIVKRLVEQEGGRIALTSPPGESAVFRVELPLG